MTVPCARGEEAKNIQFESDQELEEFVNFAFDGTVPTITEYGFEVKDLNKKNRFKEIFSVLKNTFNQDQQDNMNTIETGNGRQNVDTRQVGSQPNRDE